jgi:hypothetical protein
MTNVLATLAIVRALIQPAQPAAPQPEPAPAAQASSQPSSQPPAPRAPEVETRVPGSAQNRALEGEITPELDAAVSKGLAWLAARQSADGAFGEGRWGRSVAITSLGGLALMADGNLPGRGTYGEQVGRSLKFVLENVTESGLIATEGASAPMYGHGFSLLFLAEVYGMTGGAISGIEGLGSEAQVASRLHSAILKATRLIETTQNSEGGWRYNPVPNDADVSVTITQVMALRAVRNAGIEVDKNVIDRAVEYVKKCQNPDGGFAYQLIPGSSSLWPRSAAGVATLYYAGLYQDPAIDRGLRYVNENAFPGTIDPARNHYWYGQYYAVQTMYLAGGEKWSAWWPALRRELLASQREDGSWSDDSIGTVYGTSMALIVLQMPKRYLPIFQK